MVIVILHAILVTAIVFLGKSSSLISVCILGAKDNPNLTPAMFVPTLKRGALSYFSRLTHTHTHTHTHLALSLYFGRSQRGCLYPFNFIQILTISFVKGKDLCNTRRPCVSEFDMHCYGDLVSYLSCGMILTGLGHLVHHRKTQPSYGRHMGPSPLARMVPARVGWFLQEMPAFLIPVLLMLTSHKGSSMGKYLLLGTFCMHYFQR